MDWVTISALATAGGTLVLGVATFASVRSGSRTARAAEASLRAAMRPLLVPSRPQDDTIKVSFVDVHWLAVAGGHGVLDVTDAVIYMSISVRNVGNGVAVLHGWRWVDEPAIDARRPDPSSFTRLTRDLYISAGDVGFWQAALRDPAAPLFATVRATIAERSRATIDILYSDFDGGQRTISRFSLLSGPDDSWLSVVARHWSVDGRAPR